MTMKVYAQFPVHAQSGSSVRRHVPWRRVTGVLLLLALLCVCITPGVAQEAQPKASDSVQPEPAAPPPADKNDVALAELDKKVEASTKQFEKLLEELKAKQSDKTLTNALEELQNRTTILEVARTDDVARTVEGTEIRYRDATPVLTDITDKALSLMITAEGMSIVSEFQTITSPFEIEGFRKLVSSYSGALQGPANDKMTYPSLSGLSGLGGFFASPYASLVYSVVSLFQSKRLKADQKPSQFQEVAQIADISLQARDDAIALGKALGQASSQLEALSNETSAFFSTYAGTVGYTKSLADFNNDARGQRELSEKMSEFFELAKNKPSPTGILSTNMKKVNYNLRMLSTYVARYGEHVRSVDALLTSFGETMLGYAKKMESIPAMKDQAPRLSKLAERNTKLCEDIRKVYMPPIIHWENALLEY